MKIAKCLKIAKLVLESANINKSKFLYRIMSFDELEDIIENGIWHDFSLFEDDYYQAQAEAEKRGIELTDINKFTDKSFPYFKSLSRKIAHYQIVSAHSNAIIVKFNRRELEKIPNTKLIDFIWVGSDDEEQEERLCSKVESLKVNPEKIIAGIELIEGTNYNKYMSLIRNCIDIVGIQNITKSSVKKAKNY